MDRISRDQCGGDSCRSVAAAAPPAAGGTSAAAAAISGRLAAAAAPIGGWRDQRGGGGGSISSYEGFINRKIKKYFFDIAQKFFSFRVVLGLHRKIVPPPILTQSKSFFCKILIF
jgi:hypothetical protein